MSKKKKKDFTFYWEEPWEEVRKARKDFEEMFKTFWSEPFRVEFTIPKPRFPKIFEEAMKETKNEIILRIPLPGFKKDEVKLKVTKNTVRVTAEKKRIERKKTEERFFASTEESRIERMFRLPADVVPKETKAKMEDGVLTVILKKEKPKKEEEDIKIE